MSVAFKELGGSPVEQYSLEGFRARREFLIAWEDRDAFAIEVLGEATPYGGGPAAVYPGKGSVFAVKLRYQPFDPQGPDLKAIDDLTAELNSYSGSLAKAIVEYRTITPQDRYDGPPNEIGTHLTYRMEFDAEVLSLTPAGWTWQDQPTVALPGDQPLAKRVPVTEHRLTWHQVINPPWQTIHLLQGTVNEAEFLSCPPETLLFEGAEANKLFRAGFEQGPSEFAWQIAYVFRERSIKRGGAVYGWNHHYRGSPAGWARPTGGGQLLYDLADFNPLFQSSTTP